MQWQCMNCRKPLRKSIVKFGNKMQDFTLSPKEKLEKINQAIALDPNQPMYYNARGNVYRALNRLDDAAKEYQHALSLNDQYAEAHANLGIVLTALEKDDDAIIHLKKAIAVHPELIPALNQLSDIYLRRGNFIEARDLILQSLEKTPQDLELNHRLGIAYFKLRDFDNALFQFENVLIANHKHPEINQYLANTYLETGDHEKALHYYFRQMELNPFFETVYNIGVIFMMKERLKESLVYFHQAETMEPANLAVQLNLGNIFLKQNNQTQAILHYEKANAIHSGDPEIQHILSALKQEKTPQNAPKEYVSHLFNTYAPYYDHHLIEALKYNVPEKILQTIMVENLLSPDAHLTILDLGCGTGLCGALLKPYASQLIGIDLSEKMLLAAKEKNMYDQLIQEDITQALTRFSSVDFICAADVFTYIGNLECTFKNAHDALKQNGLFIFTVEKTFENDFILQSSIRYAHSRAYLEKLILNNGFEIVRFDNLELRKQRNEPVEGYLVLLKKSGRNFI